jgi:hypothetical protein
MRTISGDMDCRGKPGDDNPKLSTLIPAQHPIALPLRGGETLTGVHLGSLTVCTDRFAHPTLVVASADRMA